MTNAVARSVSPDRDAAILGLGGLPAPGGHRCGGRCEVAAQLRGVERPAQSRDEPLGGEAAAAVGLQEPGLAGDDVAALAGLLVGVRDRDGLRMLRDAVDPRLGSEELIRRFYTKWFAIDIAVRDLFPPDLGTQFKVFGQALTWLFGELVDQTRGRAGGLPGAAGPRSPQIRCHPKPLLQHA